MTNKDQDDRYVKLYENVATLIASGDIVAMKKFNAHIDGEDWKLVSQRRDVFRETLSTAITTAVKEGKYDQAFKQVDYFVIECDSFRDARYEAIQTIRNGLWKCGQIGRALQVGNRISWGGVPSELIADWLKSESKLPAGFTMEFEDCPNLGGTNTIYNFVKAAKWNISGVTVRFVAAGDKPDVCRWSVRSIAVDGTFAISTSRVGCTSFLMPGIGMDWNSDGGRVLYTTKRTDSVMVSNGATFVHAHKNDEEKGWVKKSLPCNSDTFLMAEIFDSTSSHRERASEHASIAYSSEKQIADYIQRVCMPLLKSFVISQKL